MGWHVEYAARVEEDFERIAAFWNKIDSALTQRAVESVLQTIQLLEQHPLIGRPVDNGLRELVIGFGKSGYVAKYKTYAGLQLIIILAIRHQREAGYKEFVEE
jgi:toxin ParE1/3/4